MVFTELGTIVGGLLTMCGLAAAFALPDLGVPVAPLVAMLGLAATIAQPFGKTRLGGPAWAALAGFAPALRLAEDLAFTGQGTLRDIGLIDQASATSTLVAGAISFTALGLAALRRDSLWAALAAVCVIATTGIELWARLDPPNSALLIGLAVCVVATELALSHRSLALPPTAADPIANLATVANAVLTLLAVSSAVSEHLPEAIAASSDWKYTAAICAVGWIVGDIRRAVQAKQSPLAMLLVGGNWGPALPGFVAAVVAAVQLTFKDPSLTAVVAIALAAAALCTLRPGRLSTGWTLAFVAPLLAVAEWQVAAPIAFASAAIMLLVAHFANTLGERELGLQAGFLSLVPALVAACVIGDETRIVYGVVFFVSTIWLTSWIVDRPFATLGFFLRIVGTTALGVFAAANSAWLSPTAALLAAVSAIEFVRLSDIRYRSLTAVLLLLAAGFTFQPATSGVLGMAVGAGLIGTGLITHGHFSNRSDVTSFGVLLSSLAWMLGLLAADVQVPEPYVYPLLFGASWLLHKENAKPWLVVAPSLFLATALAFSQRISTGDSGHLTALGAIALALTIWGSVRRQPVAQSLGAAVTVAVGVYEGLDSTVGIESWGWLVIGGAAALTVAAVLEASQKNQTSTDRVGS